MATNTATYNFLLPTVGGDTNLWGGYLNTNIQAYEDLLDGTTPVTGIDINSGSIDGTPIGAGAASTGAFTTVAATSYTGDGSALTGILPLSGGTMTGSVSFPDNATISLGAGDDLQMLHTGAVSSIDNYVGNLFIRNFADDGLVTFQSDDGIGGVANYIILNGATGAVSLYHNGSEKLLTTSGGVSVTGTVTAAIFQGSGASLTGVLPLAGGTMTGNLDLVDNIRARFGTGNDLQIFHTGATAAIDNSAGELLIRNTATDGVTKLQSDNGSGALANYFIADGATGEATMHHYGDEKLATKVGGVDVTGTLTATGALIGHDSVRNTANATLGAAMGLGKVFWMEGLAYINETGGTACDDISVADVSPSPYGPCTVFHFGAVGDGTTDDTVAIQAAVDYVKLTGSPKRLNFGFSHLISASIDMGSVGGERMEVVGGNNIAACEIIVNYTGYGSGATAGAAFQVGDPDAPAYQTAISINGFLFSDGPSITRSPIGIQCASLAQSRIDNVTFGSWSNVNIDLLTPQNVRGHNITTFGGGLSFPHLDTTGITVTQSGTTLTASASVFAASQVGKTIAIWGTGASTYRRKAKITAYTNATTVTVDQSVTDATARRVLFGSPGGAMTSGSGTLTSDVGCFTTDHVGLTICVRGAGEEGGIYRGKITSYTSTTIVGLDTLAETTVSNQEFGAPAVFMWSDPDFGNGASDVRITALQIENHKGIGLAVSDVDNVHLEGKIHSNQTIVSDDDYSISAIWASRWAGSFQGGIDAQYLGEARMVIGELTKSLHMPSIHTRLADNDTILLAGAYFPTYEGAKIVLGDVATAGGSATETIIGGLLRDATSTAAYTLNGTFSQGEYDATVNFLSRGAYADDDGIVKAEGIQLVSSDVLKYYKEGTSFTPTVSDAATSGNLATGTFGGVYTLAGNIITVKMRLLNIDTTGLTAGSSLYLGGMPYGIKAGLTNFSVGTCRLNDITTTAYSIVPFLDNGDDSILLYENLTGATGATIKVSDLSSGVSDIWMDITYEVDPADLP